jgi:hypothetical protein
MDGAIAFCLYSTAGTELAYCVMQGPYVPVSRGVQWCALKGLGVSLPGAATGTDLGGSSKYSSEILEGRRGEGFHVNSTCTWVSRS